MKQSYLLVLLLVCTTCNYVDASEDDIQQVKMKIAQKKMAKAAILGKTVRETVAEYMIEMGDLSKDQIEGMKAQRREDFLELRRLKEAGDIEGARAQHRAIKQLQRERRKDVKRYIKNNPELRERIQAATQNKRKQMQSRMKKLSKQQRREPWPNAAPSSPVTENDTADLN